MRLCLYYSGLPTQKALQCSMNSNGTELEQVDQTHRTAACQSGWPIKRSWWTKFESSLLNIYFRLSGFQFLPLLIQFQYGMNACSHCYTKVWHTAFLICDTPLLSRLAQHSFTPVQKSPPNHLSYVWTEALTGMVFMPVQELSSIVLTLSLMLYIQMWKDKAVSTY